MPKRTIQAERRAAERIDGERKRQGHTVRELSRLMGIEGCPIHPSAISEITSGDRRVSVDEVVAFARALNVTVDVC